MTTSLHEEHIEKLRGEGFVSRRLRPALTRAIGGFDGVVYSKCVATDNPDADCAHCRWDELHMALADASTIVPDAYHIDPKKRVVTLAEVEVTSPISAEKMEKILRLWLAIDTEAWHLQLLRVDASGMRTLTKDRDLGAAFYKLESERAEEKRQREAARCSFCSKASFEVAAMIMGPPGVAICGECTIVSMEALEEMLLPESGGAS